MNGDLEKHVWSLLLRFGKNDGFLSGKQPDSVHLLPGHISYHQTYDDFLVMDVYAIGDKLTRGVTHVLQNGKIIWQTGYEGHYLPEDMSLVKTALHNQYQLGKFRGYRGADLTIGSIKYTNNFEGNFGLFKGREFVSSVTNGMVRGYHIYYGGWF